MDIEFKSLEELYQRLMPALESKVNEMARSGYEYLMVSDVWNYLKEKKWKTSQNLSLHEMVSDIFNADNALIDAYFKEKVHRRTRRVYLEEEF